MSPPHLWLEQVFVDLDALAQVSEIDRFIETLREGTFAVSLGCGKMPTC